MTVTTMLIDCVHEVQSKKEKLVLIVGKPGSGKSKLLRSLADMRGWRYIDSNALITEELLELVPKARLQEAPRIMDKILMSFASEVCLVDGMQILFTPLLQLEPLQLLRQLSRKHTIVAAWPGVYEEGKLYFEYNNGLIHTRREYRNEDLTVMSL